MNWTTMKGQWKEFKGRVKEKWGKLTDDDLDVIGGKKDQLVGKVQQRYGYEKEQPRRKWMIFARRADTIGGPFARNGASECRRPLLQAARTQSRRVKSIVNSRRAHFVSQWTIFDRQSPSRAAIHRIRGTGRPPLCLGLEAGNLPGAT